MKMGNGFGKMFSPVEEDFDKAVSLTLHALQYKHGIKLTSIAQRIGVDRTTVSNARDMDHSLSGWTAFRLVHDYGEEFPEAVAPLLELCGPVACPAPDDGKQAQALRSIRDIVEAAIPNSSKGE